MTQRAALRWAPAVLWAAAIFLLSDQPGLPRLGPAWVSFLAHFGEYLVLAFLLARGANPALGFAGAGLYGITDEVHQALVPGRTAAIEDWLADVAGSLAGALLYRITRR